MVYSNVRQTITTILYLLLLSSIPIQPCGPGRGYGARRGPRKMTPLVFKQHVPNVSENTLGASGLAEGQISRGDPKMKDLVVNQNPDIIFKDEESTGADRVMSQRCRDKLNILAVSVMTHWQGVKLRVTEAWDEEGHHAPESLHYEGRAVDITTSDRDRAKYGMLARLAVEAGFDWVYYESRGHVHCSVKSDTSIASKTGGCFPPHATVQLESGQTKRLDHLSLGEKVLTFDPSNGKFLYDDVIAFLHKDPHVYLRYKRIYTETGTSIDLTADHLIYSNNSRIKQPQPIFADSVNSGGYLLESCTNISLCEEASVVNVSGVREEIFRGAYAPVTSVGTIVINNVVASCYATLYSHDIAHASVAPLRLFYRFSNSFFSADFDVGVHWYAKVLEPLARLVLPSTVWYT